MDEVLHANIFFFIASVATVIFCLLLSLILYQVLKITKSLRVIVERIEEGSEQLAKDVAQLREFVASGGIWARAMQFIIGLTATKTKKRRRTKKE